MDLTPVACRVLATLMEKEVTVPTTYPMTMNALVTACNQTTGRHPVMSLDEASVAAGMDELRAAGLARLVHASHGARTTKYRQAATEALDLDGPRGAVLAGLVLRGPQTSSELRTHVERMHRFASVAEVEATLAGMADRSPPLVVHLSRLRGQKERRWDHRLTADATTDTDTSADLAAGPGPAPGAAADRLEGDLAAMAPFVGRWTGSGAGSYPTIDAFGYTEQIEIRPVPGKPILAYSSSTRASDDGRALHGESGFLRMAGADRVELVVAQGSGIIEAGAGPVARAGDSTELGLASTVVTGTPTAKEVTATHRHYTVTGDTLTYDLEMAAVGQATLLPHLHATLRRDGL